MSDKNEYTSIKNLIKKYNDEIHSKQNHIAFYQKQIEIEKAAVNFYKEKINLLKELSDELFNAEKAEQKWSGLNTPATQQIKDYSDMKLSDLTPKGQFNKYTDPIKPLTEEQIKKFQEQYNMFNIKTAPVKTLTTEDISTLHPNFDFTIKHIPPIIEEEQARNVVKRALKLLETSTSNSKKLFNDSFFDPKNLWPL